MKKFSQLGSLLGTLFRVENVWGSTHLQSLPPPFLLYDLLFADFRVEFEPNSTHLQNSAPLIC